MGILWSIIIGLIIGLIARAVLPGRDNMGLILTAVLGMVGALIAQLLGQGMGLYSDGEPAGFIASIIGAVLVLLVARQVRGGRTV